MKEVIKASRGVQITEGEHQDRGEGFSSTASFVLLENGKTHFSKSYYTNKFKQNNNLFNIAASNMSKPQKSSSLINDRKNRKSENNYSVQKFDEKNLENQRSKNKSQLHH